MKTLIILLVFCAATLGNEQTFGSNFEYGHYQQQQAQHGQQLQLQQQAQHGQQQQAQHGHHQQQQPQLGLQQQHDYPVSEIRISLRDTEGNNNNFDLVPEVKVGICKGQHCCFMDFNYVAVGHPMKFSATNDCRRIHLNRNDLPKVTISTSSGNSILPNYLDVLTDMPNNRIRTFTASWSGQRSPRQGFYKETARSYTQRFQTTTPRPTPPPLDVTCPESESATPHCLAKDIRQIRTNRETNRICHVTCRHVTGLPSSPTVLDTGIVCVDKDMLHQEIHFCCLTGAVGNIPVCNVE